jgi:hypothetical protein
MTVIDTYSKRKKAAERGDQPEVYQYIDLPIQFRRQVIYIWSRAIGICEGSNSYGRGFYETIVDKVWQKIYELFDENSNENLFDESIGSPLQKKSLHNPFDKCKSCLLDKNMHIDHLLNLIELTFRFVEQAIPNVLHEYQNQGIKLSQTSVQAIDELNQRFREHGIGYQYNNGQIIRIDSVFLHAEAVVPALTLISSEGFSGAEQEFRSAHEHYRNQEYKAAIVDAQKAFESTMKTICDKFGWEYNYDGDTSAILINIVLKNELIPKYLQSHLSGLKRVLESGVPTVRNKEAGHGQGLEPVNVPEYLAAYALHLTASNIVLLVEAYKAKCSEGK